MYRKILAIFLALCALAGALPVGASTIAPEITLQQNGTSVADEEGELDTCGITDISVSDGTASILYHADVDDDTNLSLVLTVYEDDGYGDPGDFISTVTGDLPPSEEDTTLNLSVDLQGKQYFVLEAYITDGSENSVVFTSNLYSKTVQTILASSLADYDPDRTVALAGAGHTASFVVLKEGGRVLRSSEGYTLQADSNGTDYRLCGDGNALEGLTIAVGDALCFVDDSDSRMYRDDIFDGLDEAGDPIETERYYDYTFLAVQAVSEENGVIRITSDKEKMAEDGSDLFETVCIRGSGDSNLSWKGEKHFEKKLDKEVAESFHLSATLTVDLEYALVIQIHITKKSTAYVRLLAKYEVQDFAVDVFWKFDWESPTIGIEVPLGALTISFGFRIGLSVAKGTTGKLDFTADGRLGFQINNFKPSSLCKKPKFHVKEFSMDGDAEISLGVGPAVEFIKAVSASISWNFGLKFRVTPGGNEGAGGEATWHACEDKKCLSIKADLTMFPSFYADILGQKIKLKPTSWSYPTAEGYHSKTFKDHAWDFNFREWTLKSCPHYAHRITVTAQDSAGNPLQGVTLCINPQYTHYSTYSEGTTAASGKADLYVPNGIGYTLTGIYEDPNTGLQRSATISGIEVWNEPQALTLVLDVVYALRFDQNFSGEVTGMPEDISACKGVSVTIPTSFPEASGHQFAGWATTADASVPEFYPGDSFTMPDKNTTLYAVWNLSGNDWFVIYDANGGTGAPATVKAGPDEKITVSSEEPVRDGYTFLGWAKSKDAEEPDSDYQPGAELSKPGNASYVILHAVWLENPIVVCHVIYSANGGSGAPEDQWVAKGVEFHLSSVQPTRVAHLFAGWKYEGNVYQPGALLTLTRDAWMVAAWDPDYRIIEGAGSSWRRDSGQTLRFVCNGEYELFRELVIDGSIVDPAQYTVESGSTVATLQESYLNSLKDGEHRILFRYEDGESPDEAFFVESYTPPHTGDNAHPALLTGIMGLCVVLFFALLRRRSM